MTNCNTACMPIEIYRHTLFKNKQADIVQIKLKTTALPQSAQLQMDENSFKNFYMETHKQFWRFVFQLCGSYDLTNDIVQDSYIKFLQKVKHNYNFKQQKVFLYKIANNILKDYFKKKAIEQKYINQSELYVVSSTSSDTKIDLERFFSQIEVNERELLILAYVEGYSHNEIAEITGIKKGSVKVMLFRAKNKLINLMKGKRDEETTLR